MPAAAFLGIAWALAWVEHGSIAAADWLPYAVGGVLLLATILASGAAVVPPRSTLVVLAALLGLAAWAGISALWSPVPSLARDESLLTALYAAAFAVPLLTLASPRERLAATTALVAALSLLALAAAVEVLRATSVDRVYASGRLSFPISYTNAQAAMFVLGFWPATVLAARRSLHPFWRALAAAAAASMLSAFVLTQSKGGLLALATATVVAIALSSSRLRLLVPAAGTAVLTAAAFETLTQPYRATGAAYLPAIHRAGAAVLVVTAAGAVAGALYASIDRRVELSPRTTRRAGRVVLTVFLAAVAAGVAAFFVQVGHPERFVTRKFDEFKSYSAVDRSSSHFVSLGSNRYDFWRVAANGFADHPIVGVGARGFGPLYLLHRRSSEFPRRAHSLELEVLAEDGIVGFVLLCGGVALPLVLLGRRTARPANVAALAAGAGWVAEASVDWIWTFPAAGIPFFLLLGIGLSEARPYLRGQPARLFAAAAAVVAVFAFAPPWLSERAAARGDFVWARRLDPLSTDPYVLQAFASNPPSTRLLADAVGKEPRRADLHYLLASAYLGAGERAAGRRQLHEAIRLDPYDPFLRSVLRHSG